MGTTKLLQDFSALHQQEKPLLLGNVWDAQTAIIAEKAGYKALGSSSHAIAFSMGYKDGEEISFDELLFVVERIVIAVKIPVSVDFEAGYSDDPKIVAQQVKKLVDAGVVGINLEDGVVKDDKRSLGDSNSTIEKIKAIKKATNIFINARTDTYTTKHPDALNESITRGLAYQEAGADGIFVPLMVSDSDIKAFTGKVSIPLNLFAMPTLPTYDQLAKLGVKRISHGAKQYEQLMKKSEALFKEFLKTKDYKVILGS